MEPIICSTDKNKRIKVDQNTTIKSVLARSKFKTFQEALLCMFASPDVPQRLFINPRFIRVLQALNKKVSISSRGTLNSRLRNRFKMTIDQIKEVLLRAEFTTLTFDVWSTHENESVLGVMLLFLHETVIVRTHCIGNFKMISVHSSDDPATLLYEVI